MPLRSSTTTRVPLFSRGATKTVVVLTLVVLLAAGVVLIRNAATPWTSVFVDDFDHAAALGTFTTSSYQDQWGVYPDGWPTTSRTATYQPEEVVSVHDGVLDFWLRTTAAGPAGAAVLPQLAGGAQTYGRYSVRFRADALPGYKLAFLLWPSSERWPEDGEIDFPEGVLDGTIGAFAHHASETGSQDVFPTTERFGSWHVATTEWTPGRIRFLLDDELVGESATMVPDVPMRWVLQTETASATPPAAEEQGHVEVDWVRAWSYSP